MADDLEQFTKLEQLVVQVQRLGLDENEVGHGALVMERLHSDLNDFLQRNPTTQLPVRLCILSDVSCGLFYLHNLRPPLIHRDLTAPNILVTEDCLAKIGDLGVSRFVDPNVANKLTVGPGNIAYMPPEARYEDPSYPIKLDIFSYGVLIVHTVIGKIPGVYDLPQNDDHTRELGRKGRLSLCVEIRLYTPRWVTTIASILSWFAVSMTTPTTGLLQRKFKQHSERCVDDILRR